MAKFCIHYEEKKCVSCVLKTDYNRDIKKWLFFPYKTPEYNKAEGDCILFCKAMPAISINEFF